MNCLLSGSLTAWLSIWLSTTLTFYDHMIISSCFMTVLLFSSQGSLWVLLKSRRKEPIWQCWIRRGSCCANRNWWGITSNTACCLSSFSISLFATSLYHLLWQFDSVTLSSLGKHDRSSWNHHWTKEKSSNRQRDAERGTETHSSNQILGGRGLCTSCVLSLSFFVCVYIHGINCLYHFNNTVLCLLLVSATAHTARCICVDAQ